MKPTLRMDVEHIMGYGGPSVERLRATIGNTLILKKDFADARELGRVEERLRSEWEREWEPAELEAALADKPQASPLCSACGGDTLDGMSSIGDKIFCKKCEDKIPAYREELRCQSEEKARKDEERTRQQNAAYTEQADAATSRAFHWRDGWFFGRTEDASVRVMHRKATANFNYLDVDLTIPENEWASIVCSVSADGETSERWNVARAFHASSRSQDAPPRGTPAEKCPECGAPAEKVKVGEVNVASSMWSTKMEPIFEYRFRAPSEMPPGETAFFAPMDIAPEDVRELLESLPKPPYDASDVNRLRIAAETCDNAGWEHEAVVELRDLANRLAAALEGK